MSKDEDDPYHPMMICPGWSPVKNAAFSPGRRIADGAQSPPNRPKPLFLIGSRRYNGPDIAMTHPFGIDAASRCAIDTPGPQSETVKEPSP